MTDHQWTKYSYAAIAIYILWFLYNILLGNKRRDVPRHIKTEALERHCDALATYLKENQLGGLLLERFTPLQRSAFTYDFRKKDFGYNGIVNFRSHEPFNGYDTFIDGDILWVYLTREQLEEIIRQYVLQSKKTHP